MFHGSIVALVTPMHDDGRVDYDALARLVEFHVENETNAIVAVGTTGESATLDEHEHCEVIRRTVEMVGGRVPVIAGTGANATSEAITLTRCAMSAGADAVLLVTPYYNKPTQEGLYRHYRAIAEACAIPQILYNVPGRTAVDMKPATVARLAPIPNIVGIKEASGSVERIQELVACCNGRMDVFSGDDDLGCAAILAGARGVISVTANVAPLKMFHMTDAALAGDAQRAHAIDAELQPLHKTLFLESNPIPVKFAVARMGLIPEGIRLPLTPLSPIHHDAVRDAMIAAGVI
ncbi:MAG: 4-hydroxy-tetrahydrodipicolinate synthase [Gammaproteobacteria bacterium]|nr:4-hydroxy-tetrahydrodipicolinate synthase [Gammaproteobacteria bacterium]MCP5135765.1 4-hydroxy-tetrahydrodipicolinate synthase [Gammaproteobacteria bacterium]